MAGDGNISEKYASPNLRWALLLEDHPGAEWKATEVDGRDLDVPPGWGGDGKFCLVTITFPAESGMAPVKGWKDVESALLAERWVDPGKGVFCTCEPKSTRNHKDIVELEPTPDLWGVLSKQTLGRALKNAGYPDSIDELKGLLLWRRRLAEMSSALQLGPSAQRAIGAGDEPELDAAAVATPDHVGRDDDVDRGPQHEEQETGEVPSAELITEVRKRVGALKAPEQKVIGEWAKAEGHGWPTPSTVAGCQAVLDKVRLLKEAAPAEPVGAGA